MSGQVIRKFTRNVPHWQPRVRPVDLAKATPEQREALKVTPSNTSVSDYVLTLAHDVESLKVRSPLFNAIMYDPGGLSRAEREVGALEAEFVPGIATGSEALTSCDAVLIALPGYGQRAVFDAFAPHMPTGLPVIISSHASFGALYLRRALAARGVDCPVTCLGTTAATGRRAPGGATVYTIRARIDTCTLPASASEVALALCQTLFSDVFMPRDGLLAITLSNLKPQNHLGIALGNITRMERGETWSQGQNVTPKVGRLLEALDAESLAIAEALGLGVKTIFEHFHQSFNVPLASISQVNQEKHARARCWQARFTCAARMRQGVK